MNGIELRARLDSDPELVVLLPHEKAEVQERFSELLVRNTELADEMAEAVGPSDWHDNPAYEAVMAEMEQIDTVSRILAPMATSGVTVDYPLFEDHVTIGTRATLRIEGEDMMIDLVGQNSFINKLISQALGDIEIVSVRSPIGAAVLGVRAGETFAYTLEKGRTIKGVIDYIDQSAMRKAVKELCLPLPQLD